MKSFMESVKVYSLVNIKKMNDVTLSKAARRALLAYYDYLRGVFRLKRSYNKKEETTLLDNYIALLRECLKRGII